MEGLFKSMNIASSGLTAERLRIDIISQNMANSETTRTEDGGPYKRKNVSFKEILDNEKQGVEKYSGVQVDKIDEDQAPFRLVYDPGHPDANAEGYVSYPNVNPLKEMVDMMSAQRAYEMNAAVVTSAKNMFNAALNIGK